MDVKRIADDLRKEAKDILNKRLGTPEGFSNSSVDRLVDCIIEAAVMEVILAMKGIKGM